MDIGREMRYELGSRTHIVTEMSKIRHSRLNLIYNLECLSQIDVRRMLFESQGVDYQSIHSFEGLNGFIRNHLGISDISQRPYSKTHDIKDIVIYGQRQNFYATGCKRH